MIPDNRWTDARVDELHRLAAVKGMTGQKVADELNKSGSTFSRNAIIGKANRLGITIDGWAPPKEGAGDVFGKLTLVSIVGPDPHSTIWLCRCSCGNEHKASAYRLRDGRVKSCGCLKHSAAPKASARTGSFTSGPRKPSPVALPPRPLPPSPQIAVTCEPVSIMDLREGHCRWIVEARDADDLAMYCGGATRVGESWCVLHRALCYQPARDRRVAA